MARHIILLILVFVVLLFCFGPILVSSVNPRDCYMWDKCRGQYEKQGPNVIYWECGSVPAGCFFKGK
ncbi:hypothetical protein I4U23_022341 [Adineta vaga]|nr:hypothetical protein I4U23_022341 [Adineta vaga]